MLRRVIAVAVSAALAWGDEIVVERGGTIQAALDRAASGDTVSVPAGTYVESLTISKHVELIAPDGPLVTILMPGAPKQRVVHIMPATFPTVTGFTITQGAAERGGGVLVEGQLQLFGCVVSANVAADRGGGVYVDGPAGGGLLASGSRFTNNRAVHGGGLGAEMAEGAVVEVVDCTFDGNAVTGNGGAIELVQGDKNAFNVLTLRDTRLIGNTAGGDGGGLHAAVGAGAPFTFADVSLVNSTVMRNVAGGTGGGVRVTTSSFPASSLTVTHSVLVGNTAASGGGVSADVQFGIVNNSIVRDNVPDPGVGVQFRESNVDGGATGVGVIDADPLFVDLHGGDLHLLATSPCRDGGVGLVFPLDIDGDERPFGAEVDMGLDEFAPRLYVTADLAGIPTSVGLVAVPGAGEMVLATSAAFLEQPIQLGPGLLFLAPPLTLFAFGSVPSEGILTFAIPRGVSPGFTVALQGLAGDTLTNGLVLTLP